VLLEVQPPPTSTLVAGQVAVPFDVVKAAIETGVPVTALTLAGPVAPVWPEGPVAKHGSFRAARHVGPPANHLTYAL